MSDGSKFLLPLVWALKFLWKSFIKVGNAFIKYFHRIFAKSHQVRPHTHYFHPHPHWVQASPSVDKLWQKEHYAIFRIGQRAYRPLISFTLLMASRCNNNPAQLERNRRFGHFVHALGRAAGGVMLPFVGIKEWKVFWTCRSVIRSWEMFQVMAIPSML